jgi:hypothetical protein
VPHVLPGLVSPRSIPSNSKYYCIPQNRWAKKTGFVP